MAHQGKAITGQAQQMVLSVLEFCKAERDVKGPIIPFEAVRDRVAAMLKISFSTVGEIARKAARGEPLKTPEKFKHKRPSPVTGLDDSTKLCIRRTVREMMSGGHHPTLREILAELRAKESGFSGSVSSLRIVLKEMGLKWEKVDGRWCLLEQGKRRK